MPTLRKNGHLQSVRVPALKEQTFLAGNSPSPAVTQNQTPWVRPHRAKQSTAGEGDKAGTAEVSSLQEGHQGRSGLPRFDRRKAVTWVEGAVSAKVRRGMLQKIDSSGCPSICTQEGPPHPDWG